MGLTISSPNRYGSAHCGCDNKALPSYRIPARPQPCPDPEPELQCDGTLRAACHCLYEDFLKRFPQYKCRDEDFICCALKDAEDCVAGFLTSSQRDRALMYLAAHEIETQAVQATESASRIAAASKGQPLARPSGPGNAPDGEAYYALSVWGLKYWEMVQTLGRVGILVVG